MKIILSRKGFDSSRAGGCPSPIFQDGTMFSVPILGNTGSTRYQDLGRQGAYDLPKRLITSPGHEIELTNRKCHLDPDIRPQLRPRFAKKECADLLLFGQDSASQRVLENNGVGKGDLFLFFGLFKDAKLEGDSAAFVWGKRQKHVIWGWLQVKKHYCLRKKDPLPDELKCADHHPHLEFRDLTHNCIYCASRSLSFSVNITGAGIFEKYDDALCLTTPNANGPSFW